MPLAVTEFSLPAAELAPPLPAWELHVHTRFSDGRAEVEEYVQRALETGIRRLAFTEHCEPDKVRPGWFPVYLRKVRETARYYRGRLEIVCGLEVPAADFQGGLVATGEMLAQVDFVLGCAHRYPGLEGRRVRDLSLAEAVELEYRTLMALAGSPRVQAIAHLGGTCRRYAGPFPLELAAEVIGKAARHGVAIELNSRYHDPRYLAGLLAICRREGARVTWGSDAHTTGELGQAHRALERILGGKPE